MAGKAAKKAKSEAPARRPPYTGARAFAVSAMVVVLVLLQGGYYAGATFCVAGAGLVVYICFVALRKVTLACSWHSVVLSAMGFAYLASAISHGPTLSMLQEAATWFALSGITLWCNPASVGEYEKTFDFLSLSGVGLAAVGILMYAGVVALEGTVSTGRLMFTFQYANTAGLFFAVTAVLCVCNRRRQRRFLALVPVVALLLTKSAGAIAVFMAALAVIVMRWARYSECPRRAVIAVSSAGIAGVVVICLALGERLAQAAGTFAERIVQILDALSLLSDNVLLGIGPGQWQFLYAGTQSAQYRAADIHCSYLQIALDAGLPAVLLLLTLVIGGIVSLGRQRAFVPSLAAVMICVHALFDFDFQFAAIMVLLVALFARSDGKEPPARRRKNVHTVMFLAVVSCSLAASCGGLFLGMQVGKIQEALALGDAQRAFDMTRSERYLRDDLALQVPVCEGLLQSGDNEAVLEAIGSSVPHGNGKIGFCRMLAQQRLGMDEASCQTLSATLAANPYDADLLDAVRGFIVDVDPGKNYIDRYNEAAASFNVRAREGRSTWLPNQREAELIEAMP